eukprot:988637_1
MTQKQEIGANYNITSSVAVTPKTPFLLMYQPKYEATIRRKISQIYPNKRIKAVNDGSILDYFVPMDDTIILISKSKFKDGIKTKHEYAMALVNAEEKTIQRWRKDNRNAFMWTWQIDDKKGTDLDASVDTKGILPENKKVKQKDMNRDDDQMNEMMMDSNDCVDKKGTGCNDLCVALPENKQKEVSHDDYQMNEMMMDSNDCVDKKGTGCNDLCVALPENKQKEVSHDDYQMHEMMMDSNDEELGSVADIELNTKPKAKDNDDTDMIMAQTHTHIKRESKLLKRYKSKVSKLSKSKLSISMFDNDDVLSDS